mmetsp:Transcript_15860/g.37451  ORF Transcript_15860/g.37451 Transcript_15860/m.37451 type:complete len:83 (+) Transcript_15860:799-1047(+)
MCLVDGKLQLHELLRLSALLLRIRRESQGDDVNTVVRLLEHGRECGGGEEDNMSLVSGGLRSGTCTSGSFVRWTAQTLAQHV